MKRLFQTALLAAAMAMGNAAAHEPVPELSNAVSPEQGVIAAGRIGPGEVAALRDAGFRHVIDLTPDAETPGFDEAAAVRAAGLRYSNLPLAGASELTRENVLAFDTLLAGAERPLLVHCASGNRVGAMAALRAAWVEGHSAEEAIAIGREWGLSGLEEEVRRRIEADDR